MEAERHNLADRLPDYDAAKEKLKEIEEKEKLRERVKGALSIFDDDEEVDEQRNSEESETDRQSDQTTTDRSHKNNNNFSKTKSFPLHDNVETLIETERRQEQQLLKGGLEEVEKRLSRLEDALREADSGGVTGDEVLKAESLVTKLKVGC